MGTAGSIVWLCLLVMGLRVTASLAPTEVVSLSDANFEHATQAATGQTTGIWCVLFTASRASDVHKESMQLWTQLAADEEKEVIYAVVDLDLAHSKQLARRFKGVRVPSAVLLRDRAMYTYDIPNDDESAEVIVGFVSGGYTMLPRQVVPSPSAGFHVTSEPEEDKSSLSTSDMMKLKVAVGFLVLGLAWKAALYLSAAKPPTAATTQAGQAEQSSKPQTEGKAKPDPKQSPVEEKTVTPKPEEKKKGESAKPGKSKSAEPAAAKKKTSTKDEGAKKPQ